MADCNHRLILKTLGLKRQNDNWIIQYIYNFTDKNQLPDILYDAMTSCSMKRQISQDMKLINLNEIDIEKSLKKGLISLEFKMYVGNDEICTGFGTPACEWTKEEPNEQTIREKFGTLNCTVSEHNPCILTTPCITGKSVHKLFFCKSRDLLHYIRQLNEGKVTRQEHNDIFHTIKTWPSFKNHNLDVPVLHFK